MKRGMTIGWRESIVLIEGADRRLGLKCCKEQTKDWRTNYYLGLSGEILLREKVV